MTSAQKWIAALGLVAAVVAATQAPYEYELRAHMTGTTYTEVRTGVTHAPLWNPPEPGYNPPWLRDVVSEVLKLRPQVTVVQLDAGKLAIWWGAIAIVTIATVVLATPRRMSG